MKQHARAKKSAKFKPPLRLHTKTDDRVAWLWITRTGEGINASAPSRPDTSKILLYSKLIVNRSRERFFKTHMAYAYDPEFETKQDNLSGNSTDIDDTAEAEPIGLTSPSSIETAGPAVSPLDAKGPRQGQRVSIASMALIAGSILIGVLAAEGSLPAAIAAALLGAVSFKALDLLIPVHRTS